MSFAYGALVKRAASGTHGDPRSDSTTNKYIAAIAALVPADVLAVHALVLSWTTTTDASGTTAIVNKVLLGNSLFALIALSVVLFVIARGLSPRWTMRDYALLLVPPLAFVAWAALIGTSALTPWVSATMSREALLVGATIFAVIIIAIHARIKAPATQPAAAAAAVPAAPAAPPAPPAAG